MTAPALTACAGFLVAVLWMDLMFDSQVRGSGNEMLDESVLASIAGYYHRATTTSRPRGALIAAVMAALLGLLGVHAVIGDAPGWLLVVSAALAGGPILLALGGTVSGEHGTGVAKRAYLEAQRGPDALRAMKSIKAAMDPLNILNPGKIFG